MKHFVPKTISVLLFGISFIPIHGKAQCTCSGGDAPTPIEHLVTLDTTAASSSILTFPQFDPSIGTLSCITLHDTVSIVSTLGIRNLDPADKNYTFRLTITTSLAGATIASPSMSRNNFFDKTYGPSLLGAFGTPTDSITYGPDTLYNNYPSLTVNTTTMGPYLGTGNVQFEYEIGGGVASLAGGINFNSSVRTRTWGTFKLTYYWCPSEILAANIKNFAAVKKDNAVQLKWQVENEEAGNRYEILVSKDGRAYTSIGRANTLVPEGDALAAYNYFYALNQTVNGKLFFRVRQTNSAGKVSYSPIRAVNMDELGGGSFGIYPNPVRRNVSLQFDRELKGNYKVEIINQVGQVVFSRHMHLDNQPTIQLALNNPPAAGIYFVRVKSTETNQLFTNKLVVQQ